MSCARQGRAGPAIAALFERTLRGWHLQARLENRVIFGALRGWVRGQVPTMRIAAAGRLGVSRTPEQLRQAFEGLPSQEMLWGPLHADLHADNVRVRDGDAILIDFLSSREGPLVADPAALEASLVVSGPGDEYFDRTSWMKTVRLLYSQQSLRKPPRAPEAHDPFAWLHACVRQIRLYGLALERQPGQYAIALALALLRKALKDPNVSTAEEFRRINAYKLANTIADMHW